MPLPIRLSRVSHPWSAGAVTGFALTSLLSLAASAQAQYSFQTIDEPNAYNATYTYGINDLDSVVGVYDYNYPNLQLQGFEDAKGNFTTLPMMGQFSLNASGVNDSNQIVGGYRNHGFLLDNGALTTLDYPGALNTSATGINGAGAIVGTFQLSGVGMGDQGFLYSGGTYSLLNDPLAKSDTQATGINSAGQIVGIYDSHGFLYSGGQYTTIDDPLAVAGTSVGGINDLGQISGHYTDANAVIHGFVFSGGNYVTVDDPLSTGVTEVIGINNAGQLVGWYRNATGEHGFIATPSPVPETSTAVSFALLLALGAGGIVIAAKRKKRGARMSVKPAA